MITAPAVPTSTRLPSLDGLRAVSIAVVVASHVLPSGRSTEVLGRLGVHMFFVISGFLISRVLMAEFDAEGHVSLKRFYVRRALRILPPYVIYVGAIAAARAIGLLTVPRVDLVRAATFTMNIVEPRGWELAHTWSVSTEEQFYLAWPVVMVMLGWQRRGVLLAALLFVAVFPLIRFGTVMLVPVLASPIWGWFPDGAEGIASGCALALYWDSLNKAVWWRKTLASVIPVVAGGVIILQVLSAGHLSIYYALRAFSNLSFVLVIARSVTRPDDWWGRVLNTKSAVWLGGLSYSLYLWQQPFTKHVDHRSIISFPINVLIAMACAILSYRFIERPFVRLRSRFRSTSGAYTNA